VTFGGSRVFADRGANAVNRDTAGAMARVIALETLHKFIGVLREGFKEA
jgi:hypothetical protein